MSELPERVSRHFPDGIDLDDLGARALAIARLLEDGDRADLGWLAAQISDKEITRWFDRHGARRLSRRSRALWAAAFARELASPPAVCAALWPLS